MVNTRLCYLYALSVVCGGLPPALRKLQENTRLCYLCALSRLCGPAQGSAREGTRPPVASQLRAKAVI